MLGKYDPKKRWQSCDWKGNVYSDWNSPYNDAFVHFFANWTSQFVQFVAAFKKH